MKRYDRITFDPNVMGGKPCIRGLRVTVGTIAGLVAAGHGREAIPLPRTGGHRSGAGLRRLAG